jgi:D-proline reductase (dithiol) PrdB
VKEVAVAAHAPRFLYLHWPFGHALGEPGNVTQQRTVLHDMLSTAITAPRPGLVIDLPYRWRRETYAPIADWNEPSTAFLSALSIHEHSIRQSHPTALDETTGRDLVGSTKAKEEGV